MLVKDIIKMACEFLDNHQLAEKLDGSEALGDEENLFVLNMVECFNLVREEISTEILPIVKVDKLKTTNLKISFDEFSAYPVSIIAVKDCFGRAVKHRVLDGYVIAFANEVEVWYTACPEKLSLTEEFSSTLPERIYAYGIAREYFIKKALYKDAEIWEARLKNSIEMLRTKKQSRIVARRRWL